VVPPTLPPVRVEVIKRCMAPLSKDLVAVLATTRWPDPAPDGTTIISRPLLGQFKLVIGALVNYIETQLAACRVDAGDTP